MSANEPVSPLEQGRADLRAAELARRLAELEERAGSFQREAESGASLIGELEATARAQETARAKLAAALERHRAELHRWRQQARLQKDRADGLEETLAAREKDIERLRRDLSEVDRLKAEAEKDKADAAAAMRAAEDVRREGIEALEQARALEKKK